ncbi:MAG: glycosyltransferase, partial [Ferruginibacter sp.]
MTILFFLTFLFLVVYCGLLLYYRKAWLEIPEPGGNPQLSFIHYPLSINPLSTKISVIIPARNEAGNLYNLLTSLTHQIYPSSLFEVIVVDDYSTDDTAAIIKNFPAPNIHLLSLKGQLGNEKINSYKKKAIEIGIAASKGKLIVTTDADCFMGENWLQTIAGFYEKFQLQLIVMPVAIDCSNSPIEIFQALDFMSLQGITGAAVYKKVHS